MASEETLISYAPVTPAHKFAWRALQGFVYGSPESPENNIDLASNNLGAGKENARPPSSPQKKVSLDNIPSLASPKQRKRSNVAAQPAQLSPTKSILRTPGGAPTPRAKSLRDVNVKFKSVSPEVVAGKQRNATAPVVGKVDVVSLEREVDELWQELEASIDGGKKTAEPEKVQVVSKQKVRKTSKQTTVLHAVPARSHDPEREAYQRRTEMEVKQILRHQKKIKDYAKRADEQNVILKTMVAELKAENARLKARLEEKQRPSGDKSGSDVSANMPSASDDRVRGSRRSREAPLEERASRDQAVGALSKTEAFKRSLRGKEAVSAEPASDTAVLVYRSKPTASDDGSASRQRRKPSIHIHEDPKPAPVRQDDSGSQVVPTTRTDDQAAAGAKAEESPRPTSPLNHHSSIRSTDRPRVRSRNSPTSLTVLLSEQLEPASILPRPPSNEPTIKPPVSSAPKSSSSSTSTPTVRPYHDRPPHAATTAVSSANLIDHHAATTTTALAPDRADAARQRLKQRRERARLGIAGNGTSLAFAGMFPGADQDRGKQSIMEESAVDWAGL
jgi:hypothetical protein